MITIIMIIIIIIVVIIIIIIIIIGTRRYIGSESAPKAASTMDGTGVTVPSFFLVI